MRWFLIALVLAGAVPVQASERPNVVVILADDLGYSDLGCYGSEIPTPQLDRLAAQGLRFTQFYNAARCCPTRAALLTGLYPHQAGVGHMNTDRGHDGYRGEVNASSATIAELLRPTGYRTCLSGKWHICHLEKGKDNWPLQRGFDRFFGLLGSVRSYYDPPTLTRDNEPTRAEGDFYLTDAITDHAVRFLEDCGKGPAPLFLYVAYTAPHWPMHARPEEVAKHRAKYRIGWDELRRQRQRRQVELGVAEAHWGLSLRDPEAPAWADAAHKNWQAERMAVYAAMVERLDQGVGRIVATLREQGRLNNTLLLFLADNGGCAEEIEASWRDRLFTKALRDGRPTRVGNDPAVLPGPADVFQSYGLPWANLSNTPFRLFKHFVHEGGISTPLIAHWPAQVKKSGLTQQVGHVIDLMPTCLEAAGVTYPATRAGTALTALEGRSLLPILRGEQRPAHDALYWEHEGNRAVRQGAWKLVARHGGAWELYNLEADRTETQNQAAEQPQRVQAMRDLYERWRKRCGVLPWEQVEKNGR